MFVRLDNELVYETSSVEIYADNKGGPSFEYDSNYGRRLCRVEHITILDKIGGAVIENRFELILDEGDFKPVLTVCEYDYPGIDFVEGKE